MINKIITDYRILKAITRRSGLTFDPVYKYCTTKTDVKTAANGIIYKNRLYKLRYVSGCFNPYLFEVTPEFNARRAFEAAGFREKYAMKNGRPELKIINGHEIYIFKYSAADTYQDANGAQWDNTRGAWIN